MRRLAITTAAVLVFGLLAGCASTDARVDPNTCIIRDAAPGEPQYDTNCIEAAREAAAARAAIEKRRPPPGGGAQKR